ncbi:type 2 periplasmic-binding domain-containing protein [Ovoidimarina sediminis]|uniref:hypothetical protein n=1 Tax=Ovoidimarina sediminis TaxID=3079856 RepID=UPI00290C7D2E|nr:hypothetical protein [Rhodophyticola sp. MJ-SS7]MDU8941782.1 hypothetical protein [Rhodophyticola sp. MJ-SS7]
MGKRILSAVSRLQGNNRAVKEGRIGMADFEFAFEEVNPLPRAFRRMVREGAYDVSEMALTTYITAKAYGAKITAIPVFLVRGFHHGAIVASRAADIAGAGDLKGRRVGVKRGFTVTTGVWARAILTEEYGIAPGDVRWARSDDEHVEGWRLPPHVEELAGEGTLEEQLASGVVPAAVGLTEDDTTRALIENPFAAGVAALKASGLYPINHLVVIRDDVLAEAPEVAEQVFGAFAASKRAYVDELKAGRVGEPTAADKVHLAALEVMDDPLPYGVEANRATLERLMGHALAQGIIDRPMALEELFAAGTLDLAG